MTRNKWLPVSMALALLLAAPAGAQNAKKLLDSASQAMGAANLKSIRYAGSGASYNVGQNVSPTAPWPKFNVKSFSRVVNYETVSLRDEGARTPAAGGQEQRFAQAVSGQHAWNGPDNPAPLAVEERLVQIWVTPHGVLKAAAAAAPTAKGRTLSFSAHGKYKINATLNDQNLVQKVETWIANPVLGDMLVETAYSNYKDFNGVKFPTRIVQFQGGFPALELDVTEVAPNAAADISVPEKVRAATAPPVIVKAEKLGDGVWYLTGGSHHSVAVEFQDHVVVIEGPQSEERSQAVIAEVKKAAPNKPIRYLVNTHHHFDHSGGIRTYAAEGATILTHQINKTYYERLFAAKRTLSPDSFSRSGRKAKVEAVGDKRVLTDGSRTLELHLIKGNPHNDGILMAYLPKEKLLVEVDVFSPPAPNAPPPPTPNPASLNLYENIERLGLAVDQIAPLHGRLVPLADLRKFIGKS